MGDRAVPDSEPWDVHQHRDELCVSMFNTVYHPERGVLCQSKRSYDGTIYDPIAFKDKKSAEGWIAKGYISEIQEAFHCLAIGFSLVMFKPRESP